MAIASWMFPVLWREHDWRGALDRLAGERRGAAPSPRAALDLGAACEYVEPDRRRALTCYALAGDDGATRARELAIELGWWAGAARLAALTHAGGLAEAEAWWDAGQRELAMLALASVLDADRGALGDELAALLAHRDLGRDTETRAAAASGAEAADAHVMAARFARAAGRSEDVRGHLEAALRAQPSHAVAASHLLALVAAAPETDGAQQYLKLRLADVPPMEWIDAARACALALVDTDHHRGFGLRFLRYVLERAYQLAPPVIPGHLAMWSVLAAHAAADGTRRELLALALAGIEASPHAFDRVWLGALATEIALRDANHPVVAGAYAEIVAEHAPEHPIVKELVTKVASSRARTAVPEAAIAAATRAARDEAFEIDIDLGEVYAAAAEQALAIEDIEALDLGIADIVAQANTVAETSPPVRLSATSLPPPPRRTPAEPPPPPALDAMTTRVPPRTLHDPPTVHPEPLPSLADPPTTRAPRALRSDPPSSPPAPARPPAAAPHLTVPPLPPPPDARPTPVIPPKFAKTMPLARITPVQRAASATTAELPPLPKLAEPVLAALRVPDRPAVPPRPADPPNAKARARRIAIAIDVRLYPSTGARIDAHSRDVSESGLFVLTGAQLPIGTTLAVELLLPGSEAFTEVEYRARARIVRRGEGGYGIELVDPDAALVAALAKL